ncbi:hypothetical protein AB4Y38_43305, partial [Paraburkholderia sp. EG285A]|uniref:hypothetical protein n=1 Tax=Paraburkholderia sp. EG285A TaxID=3237009 RepID=UPI0034D37507
QAVHITSTNRAGHSQNELVLPTGTHDHADFPKVTDLRDPATHSALQCARYHDGIFTRGTGTHKRIPVGKHYRRA